MPAWRCGYRSAVSPSSFFSANNDLVCCLFVWLVGWFCFHKVDSVIFVLQVRPTLNGGLEVLSTRRMRVHNMDDANQPLDKHKRHPWSDSRHPRKPKLTVARGFVGAWTVVGHALAGSCSRVTALPVVWTVWVCCAGLVNLLGWRNEKKKKKCRSFSLHSLSNQKCLQPLSPTLLRRSSDYRPR